MVNLKKQEKNWYGVGVKPTLITLPKLRYITVQGIGDPNEANGEYALALKCLYPVAYTLKMSQKQGYSIPGFENYVVPPLEGFWWQEGIKGFDPTRKDSLSFIVMLRLPDFIRLEDLEWSKERVMTKKKLNISNVLFREFEEGKCVQCLHIGPYHSEPLTTQKMHDFIHEGGFQLDINDHRHHHEIYLSDPRKTLPERLKTIIRHPIK
jgi:hypothetical protein